MCPGSSPWSFPLWVSPESSPHERCVCSVQAPCSGSYASTVLWCLHPLTHWVCSAHRTAVERSIREVKPSTCLRTSSRGVIANWSGIFWHVMGGGGAGVNISSSQWLHWLFPCMGYIAGSVSDWRDMLVIYIQYMSFMIVSFYPPRLNAANTEASPLVRSGSGIIFQPSLSKEPFISALPKLNIF